MVQATMVYSAKVILIQRETQQVAIAELRIWKIGRSRHYPEGFKYSLFCVLKESGDVLIGFDNHKPKGHHLHLNEVEAPYDFRGIDQLVDDFWDEVSKKGFIV